ncbi:MAG: hypothetical protein RMA76_26765 [Deltaproteobacteria bacterium]|jgi:hypothetical protein
MSQVIGGAGRVKGFVFETPSGERRLSATVDFDDRAVWARRSDFDGREVVTVEAPGANGPWRSIPTTYRGTSPSLRDLHAATVDLGRAGIDVASLLRYGLAATATVRGPIRGAEIVHLQRYADNARVYDVGRVDDHGIAFAGRPAMNRISGTHHMRQPLFDGTRVGFSSRDFGVPANLRFEMDVFAPAVTPHYGLSDADKAQAIRDMNLRVESPFVPGGSQPLQYVNNVGPQGNDFRVMFQLADPNLLQNGGPRTGEYPVRLMAGDRQVASFTLDWRNG